jgi:hypothetical protein
MPETARLLKHWRHNQFEGIRPFFCQIEAVETAIWLTEVAPKLGQRVAKFWAHIKGGNEQANPELLRLALKLPAALNSAKRYFAKGLEFRSVAVMACDDEVIPLQERIESVADDADLEEVYDTERHLMYVACTRARDHLIVTGVDPVSEFLDDFLKAQQGPKAR